MKRSLLAVLAPTLALILLSGCGSTPAATTPAPTATPQVIVVTSVVTLPPQPTQTPWIIIATPTPAPTASVGRAAAVTPTVEVTKKPTAKPTATATARLAATITATTGTTATQTPTRPAPTLTLRPTATPKYTAPILSAPPNEVSISWGYKALLIWQPVGDLAEDEYYCVHLDAYRESDRSPWYGDYMFTKDNSFLVGDTFLAPFHPPLSQGRAQVYWWVSVVRKTGEDQYGKPVGVEISPPSDKWLFVAESKPE
ncbi:MAG: hypothetical protein JXM73_10320 [Anaerolineae bacterium]|nr:hypothetical protein [Anaerolineae bacterium]